ncbi:MAG TPA: Ig-like domain-containing protein, partial [Solirubrobacterales bacterium]|nr:Ig-like domain-containing protein [Solirubrobacterales bacterium]
QPVVAVCTTHAAGHAIFDDPASYERPYDDEIELAPVGTASPHQLDAVGVFDGWGYMGLYGTTPDENGKLPLLDAYAIPEAMNPDYAQGFGELSIHEQAADPTEPLSYSSYRSAGMRVFSFESGKITPQGAFVDHPGNDMGGVEQFTTASGERLIAGSDRDYGLYVLRYTGPLAPRPPACADATAAVPAGGSVTVRLACSDPNGNPLTLRIVSGPSAGALGPVQASGTVTYVNSGAAGGSDSFRFEASDGAASSAPATVTISVGAAPPPGTPAGAGQRPAEPGPSEPRIRGRCAGKAATQVGSGGRDVLAGTAKRDVILALGGNDLVRGLGGDDVICGGGGRDDLRGGGGRDLLMGQGGIDALRGGPGADLLRGGPGKDAQKP